MSLKVITLANTKGGTGKTTIAINLTAAAMSFGLKTSLINTDSQLAIKRFADIRVKMDTMPYIDPVDYPKDNLYLEVWKKFKEYDIVIIDTPSHNTRIYRSALVAANLVVMPIMPSAIDFWALDESIDILLKIKKLNRNMVGRPPKIFCLLNQYDRNTVMCRDTLEALQGIRMPVCHTVLHARQAYRRSVSEGKFVMEYDDKQATKEIESLWTEIYSHIRINK